MWDMLWGSKKGAPMAMPPRNFVEEDDDDDDDEKKPPTAPALLARVASKREPTQAETMAQLRLNIDNMSKQEEFIATKIDEQMTAAATAMRAKNKTRALHCMNLKKMYEKRQADLERQKFNVEQQLMTLQTARVTVANMQSMKDGAQMLKRLQQQVSSDDAHETIVDIEAQMVESDAISSELALPMGAAKEADEDEMLAELNAYMTTDEGVDPSAAPPPPQAKKDSAAAAPTPKVRQKEEEERALKKLEVEMTPAH
jgi:hypothetical protein